MSLDALDEAYDLSPAGRNHYDRDGYVRLTGVLPAATVSAIAPAIIETVARRNRQPKPPMEERNTYQRAFLQTFNLWRHDETVKRFVFSRRLASIAAALLGVRAVRLYHDQALDKEPGGGHTPWHQDQYYWPLDTTNTVTLWMPLLDVGADMGVMKFARGSHRDGPLLEQLPIGDEAEAKLGALVEERRFPIDGGQALRAGDATFHYGWTVHGAECNRTEIMREAMTVIYFADGARVTQPAHAFQEMDLMQWLVGCKPGDLAAGEDNRLVYTDAG